MKFKPLDDRPKGKAISKSVKEVKPKVSLASLNKFLGLKIYVSKVIIKGNRITMVIKDGRRVIFTQTEKGVVIKVRDKKNWMTSNDLEQHAHNLKKALGLDDDLDNLDD